VSGKMFYPNMVDGYESRDCEFYLGERSLYDSVHIKYAVSAMIDTAAVSAIHVIGDPHIPLHEPFLVRIKPNRTLTETDKFRTVMVGTSGSRRSVLKPQWQQ